MNKPRVEQRRNKGRVQEAQKPNTDGQNENAVMYSVVAADQKPAEAEQQFVSPDQELRESLTGTDAEVASRLGLSEEYVASARASGTDFDFFPTHIIAEDAQVVATPQGTYPVLVGAEHETNPAPVLEQDTEVATIPQVSEADAQEQREQFDEVNAVEVLSDPMFSQHAPEVKAHLYERLRLRVFIKRPMAVLGLVNNEMLEELLTQKLVSIDGLRIGFGTKQSPITSKTYTHNQDENELSMEFNEISKRARAKLFEKWNLLIQDRGVNSGTTLDLYIVAFEGSDVCNPDAITDVWVAENIWPSRLDAEPVWDDRSRPYTTTRRKFSVKFAGRVERSIFEPTDEFKQIVLRSL
jgi:hypothetical protein